jgi:hypothetical protein
VILPKAAWPLWLGEAGATPDELLARLREDNVDAVILVAV